MPIDKLSKVREGTWSRGTRTRVQCECDVKKKERRGVGVDILCLIYGGVLECSMYSTVQESSTIKQYCSKVLPLYTPSTNLTNASSVCLVVLYFPPLLPLFPFPLPRSFSRDIRISDRKYHLHIMVVQPSTL